MKKHFRVLTICLAALLLIQLAGCKTPSETTAPETTGAKRIATEFFGGDVYDQPLDPVLADPDAPMYQYVDLWVFATIRYGNEDNPDTFDATNYFLIMLGACAVPFCLMALSLRSRRNKR